MYGSEVLADPATRSRGNAARILVVEDARWVLPERPLMPRSERLVRCVGMQSSPDLRRSGDVGTARGGNREERQLSQNPEQRIAGYFTVMT